MIRLEFGLELDAMTPYLSWSEVRARGDEIPAAFAKLLSSPRVAARPTSRQWAFLRACFERLMDPSVEEVPMEPRKAAQYRLEVEKRLKRYYHAAGPALAFVFLLADRGSALRQELIDEDYPANAGYVLLVSHARPEAVAPPSEHELREYLVRLVEDAARAEFAAYAGVPTVNLSSLDGIFVHDGPAYRRIRNVVEQQSLKQWTIRVPEYNPSTMRVLSIRVGEVSETQATVFTEEYWYLRWWSETEARYAYVYNETNHQRYILTRVDGRWLVDTNVYPPPRNAALARKPKNEVRR